MTEIELLIVLTHESGHAVMARERGHRQKSFELEHLESLFGDAEPQFLPGTDDIDRVRVLIAGPLAEIRFHGKGRRIDAARSVPLLRDAKTAGKLLVYFEGADAPERIDQAYLGMMTDWGEIDKLYRAAKERNPDFPCKDHFEEVLMEVIGSVNSDNFWAKVVSLRDQTAALPGVRSLKRGESLQLVDHANSILDALFGATAPSPLQPMPKGTGHASEDVEG